MAGKGKHQKNTTATTEDEDSYQMVSEPLRSSAAKLSSDLAFNNHHQIHQEFHLSYQHQAHDPQIHSQQQVSYSLPKKDQIHHFQRQDFYQSFRSEDLVERPCTKPKEALKLQGIEKTMDTIMEIIRSIKIDIVQLKKEMMDEMMSSPPSSPQIPNSDLSSFPQREAIKVTFDEEDEKMESPHLYRQQLSSESQIHQLPHQDYQSQDQRQASFHQLVCTVEDAEVASLKAKIKSSSPLLFAKIQLQFNKQVEGVFTQGPELAKWQRQQGGLRLQQGSYEVDDCSLSLRPMKLLPRHRPPPQPPPKPPPEPPLQLPPNSSPKTQKIHQWHFDKQVVGSLTEFREKAKGSANKDLIYSKNNINQQQKHLHGENPPSNARKPKENLIWGVSTTKGEDGGEEEDSEVDRAPILPSISGRDRIEGG